MPSRYFTSCCGGCSGWCPARDLATVPGCRDRGSPPSATGAAPSREPPAASTDPSGFLAVSARLLPRNRWSSFLDTPQTLLRWHRELVGRKWTYRGAKIGRPPIDPELRRSSCGLPRGESPVGLRAQVRRWLHEWPGRDAPGRVPRLSRRSWAGSGAPFFESCLPQDFVVDG